MGSKRCRLYDENLVHNIMVSTGLSVLEYLRENTHSDSDEICDFVEANAEVIINDTIKHLKGMTDLQEEKGDEEIKEEGSDEWSQGEEGQGPEEENN
jgi:hypothetical protein